MSILRPAVRRRLAGLLVLPALLIGGCEDENPVTPATTGALNGDAIYGVSVITAVFLQATNEVVETALQMRDAGGPQLLVLNSSCTAATGSMSILFDNDFSTATVSFDRFAVACDNDGVSDSPVQLLLSGPGPMVIEFEETTTGLTYSVTMFFNYCTGGHTEFASTEGVAVGLPTDFGGIDLFASTPGDPASLGCYGAGNRLSYTLDGPRGAGGPVHVRGTLRWDDEFGFLIVEELDLTYDYQAGRDPAFALWPGGSVEMVSYGAPGGGLVPGGSVSGTPVDVDFDGFGGATFDYLTHTCVTNMRTGANPCENVDMQ